MVPIAIALMVRFATLGGSMFEDLARELPVRLRRWLELHLCFCRALFCHHRDFCIVNVALPSTNRISKLRRRSCSSSYPVRRA